MRQKCHLDPVYVISYDLDTVRAFIDTGAAVCASVVQDLSMSVFYLDSLDRACSDAFIAVSAVVYFGINRIFFHTSPHPFTPISIHVNNITIG